MQKTIMERNSYNAKTTMYFSHFCVSCKYIVIIFRFIVLMVLKDLLVGMCVSLVEFSKIKIMLEEMILEMCMFPLELSPVIMTMSPASFPLAYTRCLYHKQTDV